MSTTNVSELGYLAAQKVFLYEAPNSFEFFLKIPNQNKIGYCPILGLLLSG
jgi:hypothetical protein